MLKYIKGSDTLNFTYFKESLENSDEVDRVDSYAESVKTIRSNPMFLLIIGQINSNLIYSILIIVIIIAMFGFKQLIERSKEIATERAVGMTISQTLMSF